MLNMTTYPRLNLGGENRESISLDEDDLSDVEDEVFIRDGKNSYKMAEEINVKRPLMAPRRKIGKLELTKNKLRQRPPCRRFWKPCCYIILVVAAFVSLIVLTVIMVSLFPLPIDRIRDWIIAKSSPNQPKVKVLPCSNLKVTESWSINLPKLSSESPIRLLDVNNDGIEDILFGFGTGENSYDLAPDKFCSIFFGVISPCDGGVIALNGDNGKVLWKKWMNDSVFHLECSEDINRDGLQDCLLSGTRGTFGVINAKNGNFIWRQSRIETNVLLGNFVPDQNKDNVSDILTSHASINANISHIMLLSGKTGDIINKIAMKDNVKSFYMPQLLQINNTLSVLFGTGGPNTGGNLSIAPFSEFLKPELLNVTTLYEDRQKGILTESILVDITGDSVPDIISAMFNSTVVAINGRNGKQIWNFTVVNSETNFMPVPGYFNSDNITDFLVMYQHFDNTLNYSVTQTFILDGTSGKAIYEKPINNVVPNQYGGLSISMEPYGFDMFLFWTSECKSLDLVRSIFVNNTFLETNNYPFYDVCHNQFNVTNIMKLNILNQFDQPPGYEIYNSLNKTQQEFSSVVSPRVQIQEYLKDHPEEGNKGYLQREEINPEEFNPLQEKIRIHKYGSASFRHNKERKKRPPLNKVKAVDYEDPLDDSFYNNNPYEKINVPIQETYDYQTSPLDQNVATKSKLTSPKTNNRDPRSKISNEIIEPESVTKPKYDMYGPKNIKLAKSKLLHDLTVSPVDILRSTLHNKIEIDMSRNDEEVSNEKIDKMVKNVEKNSSLNLWNLEADMESTEKKNEENANVNSKRQTRKAVLDNLESLRKITSVGAISKPLQMIDNNKNALDIIFITYWQPMRDGLSKNLERELKDCIDKKYELLNDPEYRFGNPKYPGDKTKILEDCLREDQKIDNGFFSYFNQIQHVNVGSLTVYRLQIKCECNIPESKKKPNQEKCAQFLPFKDQSWPMFMGRNGDGVYKIRK